MYQYGQGTVQYYQQAFKWYTEAVKQNDAGAKLGLGIIYYEGNGVKQNRTKAKQLILEACQEGFTTAYDL